jgi:hypothetical protein
MSMTFLGFRFRLNNTNTTRETPGPTEATAHHIVRQHDSYLRTSAVTILRKCRLHSS